MRRPSDLVSLGSRLMTYLRAEMPPGRKWSKVLMAEAAWSVTFETDIPEAKLKDAVRSLAPRLLEMEGLIEMEYPIRHPIAWHKVRDAETGLCFTLVEERDGLLSLNIAGSKVD